MKFNVTVTVANKRLDVRLGSFRVQGVSVADAKTSAAKLSSAIAKAKDPRVRRGSLKTGDYWVHDPSDAMVFQIAEFVSPRSVSVNDTPLAVNKYGQIFETGMPGGVDYALVYRCKDFSGEIL